MFARALFVALLGMFAASTARAATLEVTYINQTPANQVATYGDATRFTARFANSVDNATAFSFADFFDRTWYHIELLAQGSSLQSLFGAYPVANVQGTAFSSTGWLMASDGSIIGTLIDFNETTNGGAGFKSIDIDFYSNSNNMSVWALWNGLPDGGVFRFYRESVVYNATGTAADFAAAEVPLPATAWLLGAGLIGLVGAARRKGRAG